MGVGLAGISECDFVTINVAGFLMMITSALVKLIISLQLTLP